MIITSVNNDLVKETAKLQQKKYRDKENKFILEGLKCVEEAINAGLNITYIFVSENREHIISEYKNKFAEKIILTTEPVLKKLSSTDSAPEILAVADKRTYTLKDFKDLKKLVLLENIKDLGNLGTIFRAAKAFNADGIILYGRECADVYNPKCVRSAVGNLWKIPFIYINDFEKLRAEFSNFERVATLPRAKTTLKNFDVKLPVILMFGSEADGLSDELINFSTKEVKIEMSKDVESLNLSVSCAVVLYKIFL